MDRPLNELFEHVVDYSPLTAEQLLGPDSPEPSPKRQRGTPAEGAAGADTAPGEPPAPEPAVPERKTPLIPSTGGVYLLTGEGDQVIQLAAAADLRRAVRTRLSAPAEAESAPSRRRRADLSSIVRRIWWRPAHSAFELTFEFHRLARLLRPSDYLQEVAFGPAWFVHVDPAARLPRFTAGKLLRSPPGVDFGPMATQSEATRLIDILQDVFDLCRYHHILEQVPHGQPCAYFEMGKCPAPCNGSIPLSQYREMIAAAVAFAAGRRDARYEELTAAMRAAAAEQAFERAAAIKSQLERARSIEHPAYRFLRPIDAFNYLVVQRGGGRTWVRPFFVQAGSLTAGQPVRLRELASVAPAWINAVQRPLEPGQHDPQLRSEHIWLVSHFLFKKDAPGLYLHASELPARTELPELVRRTFAARPPDAAPSGP